MGNQSHSQSAHRYSGLLLSLLLLTTALPLAPTLLAQKTRLDERAAHGVSQAYHQGKYYMAWMGEDSLLYVMQSDDGVAWRSKITLDERSHQGPDLASDGTYLYLTWIGALPVDALSTDNRDDGDDASLDIEAGVKALFNVIKGKSDPSDSDDLGDSDDSANAIFVMRSEDGIDWRRKVRLDEYSDTRPAIAAREGGPLLLAWKGKGNNKINVLHSEDGVDWQKKRTLDEETRHGPTLGVFDGAFYLAWTDKRKGDLSVMRRNRDGDWHRKIQLDERAGQTPSLAGFDGRLYLAWQGKAEGDIYVMHSSDGVDWRSKVRTGERTSTGIKLSAGPSMALTFLDERSNNVYCILTRDGIAF